MEIQTTEMVTRKATPYDVTYDVFGIKTLFVNVFFIGEPGPGNPWVLVDAGLPGYADTIRQEAEKLYGPNPNGGPCKPQAIVLTHGHGDHVGSLKTLLKEWGDVPVYTHRLEMPFLTGKSSYPPPDPAIGGGGMAYLSWVFPLGPIDISQQVRTITDDGHIDDLPGWRAIHTPGHAPGHISLFRDSDRTLIAGDAFITTNQNALTAVATQALEVQGPPAYFTINWDDARQSVKKLADLVPLTAGTGHGISIRGLDLTLELSRLVDHFDQRSIPSRGRYVKEPAITDENGIVSMPTPTSYHVARGMALGAVIAAGLYFILRRR
ncbi:MBL fold metallo-hydrolase [Rudanella paleaurantiibacter]|uniref:MBL fold metallo-hydrolase n=1 Tax=Rudanella paleaurantiibacter TaxID=2614655 RepID=A0A7J5TRX6_9BACT|nr:MBL fold metallo-hydrolase [Rudanella paleaurantiibacter]KAB7725613.1 MBL fold metallo-hydrolase [Rudanella paleaurantiibacter]